MAQMHTKFRINVNAVAIRPTVCDGPRHPFQITPIPLAHEPGDATHEISGVSHVDAFSHLINVFALGFVVCAHDQFR